LVCRFIYIWPRSSLFYNFATPPSALVKMSNSKYKRNFNASTLIFGMYNTHYGPNLFWKFHFSRMIAQSYSTMLQAKGRRKDRYQLIFSQWRHLLKCIKIETIYVCTRKIQNLLLASLLHCKFLDFLYPCRGYYTFVTKFVPHWRSPHRPHNVYIFLMRATSWVDIAMSVCQSISIETSLWVVELYWWCMVHFCLFPARSTYVGTVRIGSLYHIAAIGPVQNQHLANFVKHRTA